MIKCKSINSRVFKLKVFYILILCRHESSISDVIKIQPIVLELLMNANKNIGEKSALNSNLMYLINDHDRIKFYEDENFMNSLYTYDNILVKYNKSADKSPFNQKINAEIGFLKALSNNGLENTLNNLLTFKQEFQQENNELNDLIDVKYYNSWKLSIWSEDSIESNQIETYNKKYYSALKLFVNHDKKSSDLSRIFSIIDNSQHLLFNQLIANSVGLTHSIYSILGNFYNLNQIKKFCSISSQNLNEFLSNENYLFEYESQYFSKTDFFNINDDLLTTRILLTKSLLDTKPSFELKNYLAFIYDKIAENAVIHKRFQVYIILIFNLLQIKLI